MKRVHIIGRKNHGKTTLVTELVQALTEQGLRVGTIKHTHHQHELDTPGKDSFRHRESGASVVGICSPSMNAVFWPRDPETTNEQKYDAFAGMIGGCDLILVEGDTQTTAVKIEVWRSEVGTSPIAETDESISAIITDDELCSELNVPSWPRSDVNLIRDRLLALVGLATN